MTQELRDQIKQLVTDDSTVEKIVSLIDAYIARALKEAVTFGALLDACGLEIRSKE